MIDPRLQPGMHKWLTNRYPIAESHVRPHVLPDCSDALAHNGGRSHKGATMHAGLFLRPVRRMRAPPFLLLLLQINDDLSLLLVGVVAIVEVVVVLVAVAAISRACV